MLYFLNLIPHYSLIGYFCMDEVSLVRLDTGISCLVEDVFTFGTSTWCVLAMVTHCNLFVHNHTIIGLCKLKASWQQE